VIIVRIQEIVQNLTVDQTSMRESIDHPILTLGGKLTEGSQETTVVILPVPDEDIGVGRVDIGSELEGRPLPRRGLSVGELNMGYSVLGVIGTKVGQFFFSTPERGFEVGIAPRTDTVNFLFEELDTGRVEENKIPFTGKRGRVVGVHRRERGQMKQVGDGMAEEINTQIDFEGGVADYLFGQHGQ